MGSCQSAGLPGKGGVGDDGSEACPTVFELERTVEKRRGAATRLYVNLVNLEFRRGLFEVYQRGYAEEGGTGEGEGGDEGGDGEEDGEGGCGEDRGRGSGHEVDSIAIAGNPSAAAAAAVSASAAAARKKKRVEGSTSFVATHKCTGTAYSVREVEVPASRSASEVDDLWRGFDAQAALDHPNISRLQEIFCSEGHYYVVTDLCSGGDPMERLAAQGRTAFEEREAADLVRKIASALSHCHSEGVVHGNLRMESCLFEDEGRWADVKVVDAGLALPSLRQRSRSHGASGRSMAGLGLGSDISKSMSITGSKKGVKIGWYLPPEARNGGVCKEAGDMWMLGALAWQVLTGPLPQPGMSQQAGWATIMLGKPSFKSAGWASRSPEAVDFVSRLVQESCVMRRVGLRLVGRTLQAARLPPVKQAFRLLDPCGNGYITQDALAEGLRGAPYARSMNGGPATSTDQAEPSGTASGPRVAAAAAAAADTVEVEHAKLAREIFEAMDAEGSGRVGFSAFLAACLAGRPADEAGARVAFSWLDRRGKGAINAGDLKLVTGDVLPRQELEDAFSDGHDALDLMSASSAGPVGAAMREMEPAPPFSERVPTIPAADNATSVGKKPMVAAAAKKQETVAAAGGGGVVDGEGDEEILAPGIETAVVAAAVAGAAAVGTSVVGRASTSRSG
ncbi:n/a [Ectocarpus siliculosus]|uniref:N/a n=1 Tax=Ectocarpus siliculosus TaxID=2880 RepID=D7FRV3_ECTSI|nr:n/a [Ectocarpus siliculosus]|eukprot:CBJ30894.1 n/a [Ectocarpus siliculosus]